MGEVPEGYVRFADRPRRPLTPTAPMPRSVRIHLYLVRRGGEGEMTPAQQRRRNSAVRDKRQRQCRWRGHRTGTPEEQFLQL